MYWILPEVRFYASLRNSAKLHEVKRLRVKNHCLHMSSIHFWFFTAEVSEEFRWSKTYLFERNVGSSEHFFCPVFSSQLTEFRQHEVKVNWEKGKSRKEEWDQHSSVWRQMLIKDATCGTLKGRALSKTKTTTNHKTCSWCFSTAFVFIASLSDKQLQLHFRKYSPYLVHVSQAYKFS